MLLRLATKKVEDGEAFSEVEHIHDDLVASLVYEPFTSLLYML